MASKKSKSKKEEEILDEEENFLEEDDEEEVDYLLAEDAEEKIDEILGVPAIIHSHVDDYPTETHRKCRVKYAPGDHAPEFGETLILRKP